MKKLIMITLALAIGQFGFSQKKSETVEIKTSAVCGTCEKRIEHNMKFERGVAWVDLSMETKVLKVVYNPEKTDPEKLRLAVTKIGYSADDMPADKKAFKKLPGCCKGETKCEHDHDHDHDHHH